jgi:hypothetical protein
LFIPAQVLIIYKAVLNYRCFELYTAKCLWVLRETDYKKFSLTSGVQMGSNHEVTSKQVPESSVYILLLFIDLILLNFTELFFILKKLMSCFNHKKIDGMWQKFVKAFKNNCISLVNFICYISLVNTVCVISVNTICHSFTPSTATHENMALVCDMSNILTLQI